MNQQRINELREVLDAENISLDEIVEIEAAAEAAGIDLHDQGNMAGDLLNALEAAL